MPRFRLSSGILLFRRRYGVLQVFLVHPGGPYWAGRDIGAWQIPKVAVPPGEQSSDVARRAFREEVGTDPIGPFEPLGQIKQAGNKWVEAFALAGDLDPAAIITVWSELEWPSRSGQMISVPKVDRAEWFSLDSARVKMLSSQRPLLDRLEEFAEHGRRECASRDGVDGELD
jgi:predicted NUDIX family NTP pyrophosphohydrolase